MYFSVSLTASFPSLWSNAKTEDRFLKYNIVGIHLERVFWATHVVWYRQHYTDLSEDKPQFVN